ncbi:hypothetical protein D1614_08425 [Maribellus luteus]|uniref:Uncharacterized protein n=1 Tax=Maribellus luteus TaxID=2305463 RepID=A0A399T0M0_9BACT|nr:cache domain-containing protein [Maribellus luteus]RIJ48554.1 hypothetical protein D1614_08425 [Maribellus luteus]
MKSRRSKAGFNFSWILIVTLLILLYSSYFLLYIPKQEMLVKERGFRILEEYAENIHKKKDYYQTHIQNYGPYYALRPWLDSLSKAFTQTDTNFDSLQIADVITSLEKKIRLDTCSVDVISYLGEKEEKYIAFPVNEDPSQIKSMAICDEVCHGQNCALVPVATLMENLKFDKLFENIAFLDRKGVIDNSNGNVVNDITNFEALLKDTVVRNQGGVFQELEIQGMETHVLILPIRFLNRDFYLAGFISDKDFRKKTRAINNQLFTILSGILLLLLVCMPVLKIVFINKKERMNVRDAHNTTISVILGTSILVLLFIGTMKYYFIDRSQANKRIEHVSKRLTSNIENDLQHLFSLAGQIIQDKDISSDSLHCYLEDPDFYYVVDTSIYADFIPFNEIIFMNEDGMAVKAVTRTAFSNLVQLDLSNRNYFTNLKKDSGLSWPWKDKRNENIDAFFIESIKSYNTGFKETALSFRLKKTVSTGKGKAHYFAVTSHVPSFYDQVLPKDMAFMVIDRKGEVLFHSNQAKNLHENFLVESNYQPRLAGGIDYRTVERARITYNERQWLALIVPLKGVPLYHVTLIDLQMTDNKNTRIYLFTFYFLLFTFLCIVMGMQVIQRLGTNSRFMRTKNWSFEWLIFNKQKGRLYQKLMWVLLLLIVFQITGSFFLKKPVAILLCQIVFIGLAALCSYLVLKKEKRKAALVLLLGLSFLPILILSLLGAGSLLFSLITIGVFIPLLFMLHSFVAKENHNPENKSDLEMTGARNAYLVYMFLWLLNLSVVPVVCYYYSVKFQENTLAEKAEMIHVAKANLQLHNSHSESREDAFQEPVNGSGIDNLVVRLETRNHQEKAEKPEKDGGQSWLANGFMGTENYCSNQNFDILYRALRSPLTKDDYLMTLLQEHNLGNDWIKNDSLVYTAPSANGTVVVKSTTRFFSLVQEALKRVVLLLIPALLLGVLLWYAYKYIAELVLGTIVGKWKLPNTPTWQQLIENDAFDRILLIAFKGENYREAVPGKVVDVDAHDVFDEKNSIDRTPDKKRKTVWVKGLGEYLLRVDKADQIISKLKLLATLENCRIIFELPYDMDLIREKLMEQISEFNPPEEEELHIDTYLNELTLLFSGFYRFTGAVDKTAIERQLDKLHPEEEKADEESRILADAHIMKLYYGYIWNNLSRMEKLILFDLADDGMLNFKNRFLINRLKSKGLIELEPYPSIFTPGFQYFLKYSVDPDETTLLEQKLSKEGKWRNTRYLILLLLIPLAAFVFISQGTSIEKVIGILTGVLALFSGAMRIMDSSLFRSVS